MLRAAVHQSLPDEAERRTQIEEARRLAAEEGSGVPYPTPRRTLTATNPRPRPGHDFAKRPSADKKPKGHEAFLKALETSGAKVCIEKCDGTSVHGVVKHSDKFTVSIRATKSDGTTVDRIIFKHDISEFSAISPRPDTTEEGQAA